MQLYRYIDILFIHLLYIDLVSQFTLRNTIKCLNFMYLD